MMETANKEGVVAVDVVEESDNDMHPSSRTNIQMLSKMMHPVNPWTEQLTLLPSPQAPMIMRRVAVLAVVVVAYAVVSRIVHIHRFASLSYTLPSCFLQYYALCRRVQWLAKFGHTGEVSLLWCGLFIVVL